MAKHKQQKKGTSKTHQDVEALVAVAQHQLSIGKFREAVDSYKVLSKKLPEEHWKAGLAQAYSGRFGEFISKGMAENAAQILRNLKPLLSQKEFALLEAKLLSAGITGEKYSSGGWEALAGSGADADDAIRLRIAEGLLLNSSAPPTNIEDHPEVRAVLAVRRGLQAVCAADPDQLACALKQIPRQSLLSNWKLLLRALEAWYRYDDTQMRENLNRLQEVQGLGKNVAETLKWMSEGATPVKASEGMDSLALALCGLDRYEPVIRKIQTTLPKSAKKSLAELYRSLPEFVHADTGLGVWLGDWLMGKYKVAMQYDFEETLPLYDKLHEIFNKGKDIAGYLRFLTCGSILLRSTEAVIAMEIVNDMTLRNPGERSCKNLAMFNLIFLEQELIDYHSEAFDEQLHLEGMFDCLTIAQKYLPESARPLLVRAKLLDFQAHASELKEVLADLLKHPYATPEIFLEGVAVALRRNLFSSALLLLEQVLKQNPADKDTLRLWTKTMRAHISLVHMQKKSSKQVTDLLEVLRSRLLPDSTPPDFDLDLSWFPAFELALAHTSTPAAPKRIKTLTDAISKGKHPKLMEFVMKAHLLTLGKKGAKAIASFIDGLMRIQPQKTNDTVSFEELHLLLLFWQSSPLNRRRHREEFGLWLNFISYEFNYNLELLSADSINPIMRQLWQLFANSGIEDAELSCIETLLEALAKIDRLHPQVLQLQLELNLTYASPFDLSYANLLGQLLYIENEAHRRNDFDALRHVQRLRSTLIRGAKDQGEMIENIKPIPPPKPANPFNFILPGKSPRRLESPAKGAKKAKQTGAKKSSAKKTATKPKAQIEPLKPEMNKTGTGRKSAQMEFEL